MNFKWTSIQHKWPLSPWNNFSFSLASLTPCFLVLISLIIPSQLLCILTFLNLTFKHCFLGLGLGLHICLLRFLLSLIFCVFNYHLFTEEPKYVSLVGPVLWTLDLRIQPSTWHLFSILNSGASKQNSWHPLKTLLYF